MTYVFPETIAAQATPSGRGGIGVVRVSGEKTKAIAQKILGCVPKLGMRHLLNFGIQGR